MNHLVRPTFAKFLREAVSGFNPIYKTALAAGLLSLGLAGQATAQTGGSAFWPLRANAQDSTGARSAGLTATPATLRRLVVSDGSSPASGTSTPAYSLTRGQGLAPLADGSGWPSSAGGPGSAPRRTHYEQFAVTASAATRIDSLLFSAVATSSPGGRVGVMYSLSNFTADSATVTGGAGAPYAGYTSGTLTVPTFNGGTLPAANNGAFPATTATTTTGAVLPVYATATGNNGLFRFELNGAGGVVLAAGQTLTVRLYFSVNNSSTGRYVLLKNVQLKGSTVLGTAPVRSATPLSMYPNPAQNRLTVAHPAAPSAATVAVYSLTGRKVASAPVQAGSTSTELRLSDLAQGLYLVEYTDGHQRITGKITKQ
ncbi:T9SS type A sorting domain-containing protein [Hymenobacter sp. ASUV-10]|uniref:T9SS type A sorting domain-containing protein n=1 Tax=Hymenobacter aranciens TaxID=3063996 RepID=A0ABT9BDB1_9BACT|nr:T9SS type A sorting domain-containing protein [Hymenobacter sp. ASUV-10]MDO7874528.1 T9SS type A sorting domain-containing protein [Hymenobacter sp. ASUV-10]